MRYIKKKIEKKELIRTHIKKKKKKLNIFINREVLLIFFKNIKISMKITSGNLPNIKKYLRESGVI